MKAIAFSCVALAAALLISPVHADKPQGLSGDRQSDFYHLTEGADIYPYEWVLHLKSASFKDASGQAAALFPLLETRFGMLKSPNRGDFVSPYIGISVSWTNSAPDKMDARGGDANVRVRGGDGGTRSTKVVGTSCSLCHTSGWTVGGTFYRIDGAVSRVDGMGYFEELARSTITLLAKKKVMEQFLRDLGVPEPEREAKEQVDFFMREVGHDSHIAGIDLGRVSGMLTLLLAGKNNLHRLRKSQRALHVSLERLYRLTYGLGRIDEIGDMKHRLGVIAKLCTGDDPRAAVTPPGPGRFDAFDRLAAAVLEMKTGLNFDAPVRYPPMWGLKYTALVHYNANTNAVLMRNAGEAVGLGAVVTSKEWDSSINFKNLDRIEKLLYDVPVPQWNAIFADRPDLHAKPELAARGKAIYEKSCKGCHETDDRVGPTKMLYQDRLYPASRIGTDPRQAENLDPIGERMNQALRTLTLGVRGRYYEKQGIPEATRADWELRDLRGGEFFRWTHNGESVQQELYGNNYGNVAPGLHYRARHLAGIWAVAPFLHNGSVPTLWDLLQPSSHRPRYFRNTISTAYDPIRMGIYYAEADGRVRRCKDDDRECFDTTLPGNDNRGHEGAEFGTELSPQDKQALMEYLKVLEPVPEYGW
jgi:cytochrome c5